MPKLSVSKKPWYSMLLSHIQMTRIRRQNEEKNKGLVCLIIIRTGEKLGYMVLLDCSRKNEGNIKRGQTESGISWGLLGFSVGICLAYL